MDTQPGKKTYIEIEIELSIENGKVYATFNKVSFTEGGNNTNKSKFALKEPQKFEIAGYSETALSINCPTRWSYADNMIGIYHGYINLDQSNNQCPFATAIQVSFDEAKNDLDNTGIDVNFEIPVTIERFNQNQNMTN